MQCQNPVAFAFLLLISSTVHVSSNITVSFQSEVWSTARRKSAYGTYNRHLYMVGGLAGDWTENNANIDIVRYSMDTKTTNTLSTAPPYKFELRFPSEQCQIDDTVYYTPVTCAFNGCYYCDGSPSTCFVWKINLQTEEITQLTTQIPVVTNGISRGALCGFVSGEEHHLFHIGGQPNDWEGAARINTYLYNTSMQDWMSMNDLLIATSSASCIGYNEFLFVFAGRQTTAIQIYDFNNNQWSQSTHNVADQVMNMMPLQIHNYIFLFGGGLPRSDGDNYGNNAINTIYVYDIQEDKLTKSGDVLTDETSAAAIGYDEVTGLIHIIGGQTSIHLSLDTIQIGTIDWGLTDAPTTATPTQATNDPTSIPSVVPTSISIAPSLSPTQYPTNAPSLQPSIYPTNVPSLQTSNTPIKYSTISPSQSPAHVSSSLQPTANPSKSPTETLSPTKTPTYSPSVILSDPPSMIPSIQPSKGPTEPVMLAPIVWDVIGYFSDSYLEIFVDLLNKNMHNNQVRIYHSGNVVQCNDIFVTILNGTENTELLNGAKCTFVNHLRNIDIVITLSSLSTITPNNSDVDIFIQNGSFHYTRIEDEFESEYIFDEVQVSFYPLFALHPTTPNIVIMYASTIGLCDSANVDARSTTNLGGKSGYFTWKVLNSYPNELNSHFALASIVKNGSSASVLSDINMDPSSILEIELTVESWFGQKATKIFNITKVNDATPIIVLRASPSILTAWNQNNEDNIYITAYITYNASCVSSTNDDYALEWNANPSTSLLQLHLDSLSNMDHIWIPSHYLSPGNTYSFEVELISESLTSSISSVSVVYDFSLIQCQIASSDAILLDEITRNQMKSFELRLDGDTFTFDYDSYDINNKSHLVWIWSCFKRIESEELETHCDDLLHPNTVSQTVIFEDETYETGEIYHYFINMEVKDMNSPFRASCNDSIEFVAAIVEPSDDLDSIQILSVAISTVTSNIHWNDKLRFIVDVSNLVNDGQIVTYNWTESTQLLSIDVNIMNENEETNGNLILSTAYLEQGTSYSFKLFVVEYNDEHEVLACGSSIMQIYINHGPFIVENSFVIDPAVDDSCEITYSSLYDALTTGYMIAIEADADYLPLSYLFSYSFNTDHDLKYMSHSSLSSQSFIQNILLPIGEFTIFAEVYDSQSNKAINSKSCQVSVENSDDKQCVSYKQIFNEYLNETIIQSSHDIVLFLLRSSQIYVQFMSMNAKHECIKTALNEVVEILYDELITNTHLNINMCTTSQYTIPFAHVLSSLLSLQLNNQKIFNLLQTALDPCDFIQTIESLDDLYLDTNSIITNVAALYYEEQNILSFIPQITRISTASNLFYSFISCIISFMEIPSNHKFKTEIQNLFNLAHASLYIHSLLQLSVAIPGEPLSIDGFGLSVFALRVSPNATSSLNVSLHNISIAFDSDLFKNDKCSKNTHINSQLCSVDIITMPLNINSKSIQIETIDACNEVMMNITNISSDLNAVSIQIIGSDFNLSSLPSNISITFALNSSLDPNKLRCVWYNEIKDVWAHDGCVSYVDIDHSIIHCVCNHLTIFGTVRDIHYDDHLICNVFNDTNWRYVHIIFLLLFIMLFCYFCLQLLPFIISCKYSIKFLFSKHSQLFILLFAAIISILNAIVCAMFSLKYVHWNDANISLLTCLYMLSLPFYFMIFSKILIAWHHVADSMKNNTFMRSETKRLLIILCVIYCLVPLIQMLLLLLSAVQNKYIYLAFDIFWTMTMLLSAVLFLLYGYKMVSVISSTAKVMQKIHNDSTEASLARKLAFIAFMIVLFFTIQCLLTFYFLFDFNDVSLEWRIIDLSSHVLCLIIIAFMYQKALKRLRLELDLDSFTCCNIMTRYKIQIVSKQIVGAANAHNNNISNSVVHSDSTATEQIIKANITRVPTITAAQSTLHKISNISGDQSFVTQTKIELSSHKIDESVTHKKQVFTMDNNNMMMTLGFIDEIMVANAHSDNIVAMSSDDEMTQTQTMANEGEGVNKYGRIERLLQECDDDWNDYLDSFKKQKIDDEVIFSELIERDHEIWQQLVPEIGVRLKLFRKIYAKKAVTQTVGDV